MTGPGDQYRTALTGALQFAVPFTIAEFRSAGRSTAWLIGEAKRMATIVATHGDNLQFGGKHTGPAFNALVRGLACLALTDDSGASFEGLHWCRVPRCPGPAAHGLTGLDTPVDGEETTSDIREGLL